MSLGGRARRPAAGPLRRPTADCLSADRVHVAPLPAEFELELQSNRTGGLVISEFSFTTTVLGQEGFGYAFGG